MKSGTKWMRMAMTGLSFALLVLLFLLLIDVLTLAVRVLAGLSAVIALFGIVALGLIALVAPAVIYAAYAKHDAQRPLTVRFLLVTGIQGVLFFLTEVGRRALLHAIGPEVAEAALGPQNQLTAILGIGVGSLSLAAAWIIRRRSS